MAETKLFKYFLGRHVNVIMKNIKGSQTMTDGSVVQGNVVIEGYLLDEDDIYLYLGRTLNEVDESLQKPDVIRIFTAEPQGNEFIEMHDEFDDGSRH